MEHHHRPLWVKFAIWNTKLGRDYFCTKTISVIPVSLLVGMTAATGSFYYGRPVGPLLSNIQFWILLSIAIAFVLVANLIGELICYWYMLAIRWMDQHERW